MAVTAAAPVSANAPPPVLRVDPADLPPVVAGPGAGGDEAGEEGALVAQAAATAAAANGKCDRDDDDNADPWWRLRYPLPEVLRVQDDDEQEDEQEGTTGAQQQQPAAAAAAAGAAAANGSNTNHPPPTTTTTPSARAVRRAAALLRKGLPVALPTETVYGLACDATSAEAAARVFAAKGRPQDNPLIVHVSSLEMLLSLYPRQPGEEDVEGATEETEAEALRRVLRPPNDALARAFWPGPLTLLLPASPRIPSAVTAGHATVAVRMPAHPVARAVIAAAGVPLAAPSANVSGRPSPTEASHVAADFAAVGRGTMVPLVLDGGGCSCGVESTVAQGRGGWGDMGEEEDKDASEVAATPGRNGGGDKAAADAAVPPGPGRPEVVVLRPGGVTPEQIQAALLREYGGERGAGPGGGGDGGGASASPLPPRVVVYGVSEGAARDAAFEAAPTTPGMKYRHYSPDAPVLLVEPPAALLREAAGAEAEAEAQARWRRATADAVLGGAARALLAEDAAVEAAASASGLTIVLLRTTLPPGAPEGWQQQQQEGEGRGRQDDPLLLSSPSPSAALAAAGVSRVLSYNLGPWRAPEVVARRLFAGLRAADAAAAAAGGPAVIVAEGVPSVSASAEGGGVGGVGVAVMNRLRKAAARVIVA
jgi:L-threonylcarbamoyladenylate synthase